MGTKGRGNGLNNICLLTLPQEPQGCVSQKYRKPKEIEHTSGLYDLLRLAIILGKAQKYGNTRTFERMFTTLSPFRVFKSQNSCSWLSWPFVLCNKCAVFLKAVHCWIKSVLLWNYIFAIKWRCLVKCITTFDRLWPETVCFVYFCINVWSECEVQCPKDLFAQKNK